MKLISLELHLYKPLMHNGVRHVTVDEFPSITVIAGENGSGKSSLLRECTPYPSCRTDYDKGGSKKIVYEHGGSTYILTSDFNKTAGAHSFIKDGVELNESGTTEVQIDLVESHFDYNDIIHRLMSGKYNLCDMGKPDRKALIMSTYPSSLSFMLEYHKVLSSEMRAIGNNIKMLSQRELSLKGQIISPTILNDYRTERDDLDKAVSTIDMDAYTINKAIEQANKTLEAINPSLLGYTPETFLGKMRGIQSKFKALSRSMKDFPDASKIKIVIERLNNKCQALEMAISDDNRDALTIRHEIDQYTKCLSTDTEQNIAECKRLISMQEDIINGTTVDNSLPALTKEEVDRLKSNYTTLLEAIARLKQSTIPFWSEDQYKNTEMQLSTLQMSIATCNERIANMEESIQLLKVKLARQARNTWPEDCKRVCPLRSNLEDILNSIQKQIDTTQEEHDKVMADRERFIKTYEEIKTALQLRAPDRKILIDLDRYFLSVSWASYALNNLPLIESLNSSINKIYNSISCLLSNSENLLKVKEAKEIKSSLEAKLLNLETNSAPAEQLIKESIIKKEAQLNALITKINKNKKQITSISAANLNNQVYDNLLEETQRIESDYVIWKKSYVLQQEIQVFRKYIDTLMDSRAKIQTKLRELDSIIKEQDGYLIRLNDEVLPELQKLQARYDELAIIEAQISPTKGIPHLYTTKYINSILVLANRFIARVWAYPMELQYIDENDESYDFSFPVILNGNSSVKDCNICSNGQKSIINLCFTLAICIFRQYSECYPLTLDEVSDGLSVTHASNLVTFLAEILSDPEKVNQVCIVDHNVSIASSFCNSSKMLNLSKDTSPGEEWQLIGNVE